MWLHVMAVMGMVGLVMCQLSPPEVAHQLECSFSVETSEEFIGVSVQGIRHYNYDLNREMLNFTRIGKIPVNSYEVKAYDIDSSFLINNRNGSCDENVLNGQMDTLFAWTNATSAFPSRGIHFINETVVNIPTGDNVTCNLWEFSYLGECGPTIPPPCSTDLYLCATGDNIPVMWKVVKNNTFLVEYFWDVVITPQNESLFDIPEICKVYDYPNNPPFGLEDGFENGQVAEFWIPCGTEHSRWECGHIFAQKNVVRSGNFAANITIQPGDISQPDQDSSTERDELDSRTWQVGGDEDVWYGMSFLLPTNFPLVDDRLVMGQWKQSMAGDKHPLIAQRFVNNTWYYTINVGFTKETYYMEELELGIWHDMIYQINFSPFDSGYFRAWHNGTQVIDYSGRTAYDYMPQYFYHKFGLYRDPWPTSWTVFFDK